MLVIRDQQMKEFSDRMDRDYHQRLEAFILETFPNKTGAAPPGSVSQRVAAAVEEAIGYGLETERQIASYTELVFAVGKPLDETFWGPPVLEDENLSPDAKILRLQVQAKLHLGRNGK